MNRAMLDILLLSTILGQTVWVIGMVDKVNYLEKRLDATTVENTQLKDQVYDMQVCQLDMVVCDFETK